MTLVTAVLAHIVIHGSYASVPANLVMPHEGLVVLAPLLYGIWAGRLKGALLGTLAALLIYFLAKLVAFSVLLGSVERYLAYGDIIGALGMLAGAAAGIALARRQPSTH